MTEEQEKHLTRIRADFDILAELKYRKGQKEHGGDLFTMTQIDLVENAIFEAVDLVIYLLTLRENMQNGKH